MLSKLDRQQQISKLVISSLLSYLFQTIFVTRSLGTTCGRNLTRETPASHIAVTKTDNQDHHQLSLRLWTGTMESGEYAFMHYSPLSSLSHVPHFPLVTKGRRQRRRRRKRRRTTTRLKKVEKKRGVDGKRGEVVKE